MNFIVVLKPSRQQISQYDLAAMVGGGREYVARTLSNWQDRKLVSRRRSVVCTPFDRTGSWLR